MSRWIGSVHGDLAVSERSFRIARSCRYRRSPPNPRILQNGHGTCPSPSSHRRASRASLRSRNVRARWCPAVRTPRLAWRRRRQPIGKIHSCANPTPECRRRENPKTGRARHSHIGNLRRTGTGSEPLIPVEDPRVKLRFRGPPTVPQARQGASVLACTVCNLPSLPLRARPTASSSWERCAARQPAW